MSGLIHSVNNTLFIIAQFLLFVTEIRGREHKELEYVKV